MSAKPEDHPPSRSCSSIFFRSCSFTASWKSSPLLCRARPPNSRDLPAQGTTWNRNMENEGRCQLDELTERAIYYSEAKRQRFYKRLGERCVRQDRRASEGQPIPFATVRCRDGHLSTAWAGPATARSGWSGYRTGSPGTPADGRGGLPPPSAGPGPADVTWSYAPLTMALTLFI